MNDGHFIDDPLMVVNTKPDFSGIGLKKHLTDEQKNKLYKALNNFLGSVVYGPDAEIDVDNFDEIVQSEMIKPFIEPLINGEL